jgi:hypothetical protein
MKNYDISEYKDTVINFTLIDGLSLDIIKRKYIWLLNALVENAIIGQDDYGLVWYSGNWLAGEWEDGTWYSGIWYDGEWKNGKFYSIRFDKQQLLLRNKRILEKDNPIYSQFRRGIWRRGEFYGGYFGPESYLNSGLDVEWSRYSKIEMIYWDTRWESGTFYNGIFRNAVWLQPVTGSKSIFSGGIFYNSQWFDGTFSNGTFQGAKWWIGNFTGGDFVSGDWMDGNFNQSNPNIKSRFGSMPITGKTSSYTVVNWYNGNFINGEFYSGLNIISGYASTSDYHKRTIWHNGLWQNGLWYGGTFVSGTFNNGHWFEGFWSGGTFNNGYWYNGYWLDGVVNDGYFIQGIFKNVKFNNGQLGYQPQQIYSTNNSIVTPPKLYSKE